jgi:hypothetical protein
MQTDKIHRRSNGTIDIDAYRKEASALRTQTFKRFGRVATECLLRLTTAFVKYTHEKRSFLPRYSGYGWCDSTERALSNELMGRRSWFNSKYF